MIYLFGWNSVAEFIADELEDSSVRIDGVIVDDEFFPINNDQNIRAIPFSNLKVTANDVIYNCVGYRDLLQRVKVGEKLNETGALKSFISRKAVIARGTKIEIGAVLLGDVVTERNSFIGSHSLLWGGSRVCHDAKVGTGCFLAAGSVIGGHTTIGAMCSIGFNSSVKEKNFVPDGTKIGANLFYR